MNADKLPHYAVSPVAFFGDVPIRTQAGYVLFSTVATPFQLGWLAAIEPALLAASAGMTPKIRKFWAEAVKGSAKTSMLAMIVLWALAFSRRPLRIQIGAFDSDQAAEVRMAAQGILWSLPWLAERVTIDKWQLGCKATGSTCEILASDPHGTSGGNPDIVILDEAVQITREEYAAHTLNNAAKRFDSITLISTNAGFKNSWQFRLREIARTSPQWSFHQGLGRPPQITEAEFEEARRFNTATRFARYFLGVWASGSGDALDENDLLAAVDSKLEPMVGNETGFAFALGLDLGIRHDHSALTAIGVHSQTQRIRLARCESWAPGLGGRVDLEAVETTAIEWAKIFRAPIYYDPYQCELLAQRARKYGGVRMVEIPFSGSNLNRMASDLLDVFRSRRIDLYPDKGLLRDLRRLTIVEKNYGFRLESTRDADGHADKATSLALSLLGAPDALSRPTGPWGGVLSPSNGMYGEHYRAAGWQARVGPSITW